MGRFVIGDIVVVPFPFSASEGGKRRPAVVLAEWPCAGTTDYLLSMISCRNMAEPHILPLATADIENGTLTAQSYLRPTYMFAVTDRLILHKIGNLRAEKLNEAMARLREV